MEQQLDLVFNFEWVKTPPTIEDFANILHENTQLPNWKFINIEIKKSIFCVTFADKESFILAQQRLGLCLYYLDGNSILQNVPVYDQDTCMILIMGAPEDTKLSKIVHLFAQYGEVTYVAKDAYYQRSCGCCYVNCFEIRFQSNTNEVPRQIAIDDGFICYLSDMSRVPRCTEQHI